MSLKIYNTLSRTKEDFKTLEPGKVRMYVCGPTVYAEAHIGHAMSALVFDIVRRYLEYSGYDVNFVMNFTDVDDKIINKANELGRDPYELADQYIRQYKANLDALNIKPATKNPRATEDMPQIIEMISQLIQNGSAYEVDGDVYYDVESKPDYGKLSGRRLETMNAGARIQVDERKAHPMDFALWKTAKPGEPAWDSPWGKGRPGWHIECSAMNMAHLGEQIDIHGGGNDLIFPHHENEIAQSESLTGKPFARFWLHSEFLLVEGQKMSKSLGNFYTLRDVLARGYAPEAIRYLLASVPYRKALNFTFDGLKSAATAIDRLRNFKLRLETEKFPGGENAQMAERIAKAGEQFESAMNDDLNTAEALGAVFEFVREANIAMDGGGFAAGNVPAALEFLARFDAIFDVLTPSAKSGALSDAEVEALVAERTEAKKNRDFARADAIRAQLQEQGILIEDTKSGVRWKRR